MELAESGIFVAPIFPHSASFMRATPLSATFALIAKTLTVSKTGAGTGSVVSPVGCGEVQTASIANDAVHCVYPIVLRAFTYNPRFPGQLYDAETGLYYNYQRNYSPQTGTYTQPDPIGLAGGINPYSYVRGNPVNARP